MLTHYVKRIFIPEIPLTKFDIFFARYVGIKFQF